VVTGVLLVGCSNVANLVMARAVGRRRELAIRAAMGAKRSGVVRQLLIESLMLSLLGGAGGLLLAEAGFRVIRAAAYEPFFELVKVDRQVLVFAAALSLVTPLVFSLIPALQASRAELADLLRATGGRGSAGPRGRRGRNVFVVSQLAIACSLMILAMLVVRTVDAINRIDWGFDSSQLLTLRFELPREKYQEDRQLLGFLDGLLPRLRGLPGVQQAAVVSPLPIFGEERTIRLTIEDWVVEEEKDRPWAVCVRASDHYLETLGLPLLQGRGLSRQDTPQSKHVALINQELAERYWPDIDPVGRHFAIENEMLGEIGERVEVVGVTGDIRSRDLTDAPSPTVFLPFSQSPVRSAAVVLRSTTNPTDLVPAIRHEFREADPDLAIYDVKTMTEAYDEDNASTEILSGLFSAFAVIALLMSVAGLYAMVSYTVSQRKHEISIRMALGARGADIRSMVLGEGAKLTGLSIGLGLLGGWALGRLIASELYGVTPTDPMTYAVVALILAAVALAGSFVPAYRATRVDPIQTLRSE
jgi:putative ABC transport system permease protein